MSSSRPETGKETAAANLNRQAEHWPWPVSPMVTELDKVSEGLGRLLTDSYCQIFYLSILLGVRSSAQLTRTAPDKET